MSLENLKGWYQMAKLKKEVAVIEEAVFVKTDETRFYELEGIVAKGLSTFIQVGKALMELRDGKSYKAVGYETFEDLCQRGFGIGKSVAYDTIKASELAGKMSAVADIPNERTARELLPSNLAEAPLRFGSTRIN